MSAARIRDAGDSAVLLELEDAIDPVVNARAIAIAETVRRREVPGVREVVSTFRSVAVYFEPLATDVAAVRDALVEAQREPARVTHGRLVDVPVVYGGDAGPDLEEVAAFAGIPADEVVSRHCSQTYRVFMLGFLPGFAYMASVDERIAAPRRATPRLKVPAGSVGIAGRQTGVYSMASPGGWQIIGRTALSVFDPARERPALFAAGDSVRFVAIDRDAVRLKPDTTRSDAASGVSRTGTKADVVSGFSRTGTKADVVSGFSRTSTSRAITVISPGLFTTIQDEGRWGHQALGVSVSGAMDAAAHSAANALAGNDRRCATLELTLQGPELRFDAPVTIAVAGADLQPSVDGRVIPHDAATSCVAGSILRFGERRAGARAYLAIQGGIDIPPVLGSRATHTLTMLGGIAGRALRAGDVLPLGGQRPPVSIPTAPSSVPRGGARLRVMRGPQDDRVAPGALDALQRSRFTISPQSNRMGYRLTGGAPLARASGDMISDATFAGAVQVPPSGDPILLMADRQTTGGYPQIATVITADLPLAAQLAPGDWIEFQVCSREAAIAALAAQEAPRGV